MDYSSEVKDTEIEIQVKVDSIKTLLDFLKKHATFKYTTTQIDNYYTPKHKDFTSVRPIKEWLRLRKSENGSSINYKNWKYDRTGKSWHCDEYETKIADLDQMRKIFVALNLKLLTSVNKNREVWHYKSFEVSIDKVRNLGNFIEVEYKGRAKKRPKEIVSQMLKFLKDQKCGKIFRNNGGYPFMLLFPKEVEFEEIGI